MRVSSARPRCTVASATSLSGSSCLICAGGGMSSRPTTFRLSVVVEEVMAVVDGDGESRLRCQAVNDTAVLPALPPRESVQRDHLDSAAADLPSAPIHDLSCAPARRGCPVADHGGAVLRRDGPGG